ncbi:MAG: hypothetical protein ACLTCI_05500 [[Clostridium] nexile]
MYETENKKICAVFVIIVLLPYIITIFMNGKSIEANQDGKNGYIKVKRSLEQKRFR